ncbi:sucrose transport protein SUT1-like [Phalaenopsis equestris]|uniref:sucrose transport protein SUT1-like n=1 Tax=Phalaenopsis equestris TaxID=78828 RepID=UPI0009E63D4D|nr:sucrose transport protein SUT1-like [Phalaenopsis equestris]
MDSGEGSEISERPQISLKRLIFACTVAGGVQYGWALQLSLLTPYIQTLGLPHALASIMWLCGPVAGFVVGPSIGYWSDKCRSKFGRRRPFILSGCLLICCCVLLIGFSSDIGSALGDTKENCSTYVGPRWKAAIIYVVGFWVLDFSNNAVQGPARAMMADLSGKHGCNAANLIYAFWMAFGNILGYSSGSTGSWHKWFPFLLTNSCCATCANLKAAFLVAIVFLLICLTVTLFAAKEVPLCELEPSEAAQGGSAIFSIFKTFKSLPAGMPSVLIVTALTWLAWFPFILYDTDWMGREIYHGDPSGTKQEIDTYNKGVEEGAFGLLLNSLVLAITSMVLGPLCRKFTSKVVWITGNFILFLGMAAITVLSVISTNAYSGKINSAVAGPDGVKLGALAIFTALGFPLAILYSIPFACASQLAADEGGHKHGLCIGVLNVSIVIPQVFVSLGSGPWDALFGKGNIPAFALSSGIALIGGFIGLAVLPKISSDSLKSSSFGSMH